MALCCVCPYLPHIAQQFDFQACEHFKFILCVGFASHLKVGEGHKNLSKTLGMLSKWNLLQGIWLEHPFLLFSFDLSRVLPFPTWRSGRKTVRLDLGLPWEKEGEIYLTSSLLISAPEENYKMQHIQESGITQTKTKLCSLPSGHEYIPYSWL